MSSAPPPGSQRGYRAACPNCGAPVEFASAASPVAICGYCRSTLVREGDALKRIGRSAELFDDHSPLQLGTSGRHAGAAFRLVGRLQMRYAGGSWNEWHALFDSGRSGWLSEDNGRYAMAFDVSPPPRDLPAAESLRPGFRAVVDGRAWQVASVVRASVAAAEGELPFAPAIGREFAVADLRRGDDEVATLDWSDTPPHWTVGHAVALADLALQGLREASEKTLGSRALQCPSCGAAIEPKLDSTRSIACGQCHAVVDVSGGVGAELSHYAQAGVRQPQIPLGQIGQIGFGGPPLPWQVVGYVERFEVGGHDDDDESTPWREYLLYHRKEGFAFLVDAEDGWSWSAPIAGAPEGTGDTVRWRGTTYRKLYDYVGEISFVLGEFYWKVERGQRTTNTDYAAGRKRLYREQTGGAGDEPHEAEVTWSAGETLDADVIVKAFRLPAAARAQLARDASPLSGDLKDRLLSRPVTLIMIALVAVVVLMNSCSDDDCDEIRATFGAASNEYQQCVRSSSSGSGAWFRSRGGSYGGFGSGGGHK